MDKIRRSQGHPIVLLVTDDMVVQATVPRWLHDIGVLMLTVTEIAKASALLTSLDVKAALIDLDMTRVDTAPFLSILDRAAVPAITLSSGPDLEQSTLAHQALEKPLDMSCVIEAVSRLI